MKKNQRFLKKLSQGALPFLALALPLMGVGEGLVTSCSPDYDLGKEDPEWLGNSIYDYLQTEGNFKNTIRLIDDLNYAQVLGKTGSKTLFVADDEAFERFYRNNTWGVTNYGDLSLAQKKMLLYGSMINNACQVAYLSSSQGPIEGDCMRRMTSSSIYDSVQVMSPTVMPDNPFWKYYRDEDKTIPCLTDMTSAPMVHFIDAFLTNQRITVDDCNFLFNVSEGEEGYQRGEAYVNGIKMVEQNIKCSNGFIHRMAEVMTPLTNMAQLINDKPQTSMYAKLLDRYCAPYYNETATREYNRLYNTNYDSVFQKRYFSERSQHGLELNMTPNEEAVNGKLKFDPGWNEYYSQTNAGKAENVALQENMGVMLVPTNKALQDYWENGGGKVLRDNYGTWDNVPDKVISKMINVNMLNSLVNSVPSKFETVLDDANDAMGLAEEYVDSVWMACNGAIYLTNVVFNPVAYVSVSFPALINEKMSIFNWAIEQCGYDVYLNSQNSYYSLFIPTNKGCLEYIDPCSYGKTSTQLFRFHYDPTAISDRERVWASIWNYDTEKGEVTDSISEASYEQIRNRLEDILNTHIVIGNVEDGNEYYRTKGGSTIRVRNVKSGIHGMTVQGTMQIDRNKELAVTEIYDQTKETNGKGNGKTYILDEEPIMTTRKAVSDILAEHEEFSAFWELLERSQYLENKHVIGTDQHGCASNNISLFNTFQYTVYVPTNDAIAAEQKAGKLPTWDMVAQAEEDGDDDRVDSLTHEIELFLKYHIQDNSTYIGQGNVSGTYETSAYKIEDENLSYYKVTTNADNSGITIKDESGNTRHVTKNPGLYNLQAREYQYDAADATKASQLYTSSYAVVHQIDGVLNYRKGGKQ